jgi:hypothetical protein
VGPLSIGLLTDYVYADPLRIGSALALVAIAVAPITTVLAFTTRAPFARLVRNGDIPHFGSIAKGVQQPTGK